MFDFTDSFYVVKNCTTCYNTGFICGAKPILKNGEFHCPKYEGFMERLINLGVDDISSSVNAKIISSLFSLGKYEDQK